MKMLTTLKASLIILAICAGFLSHLEAGSKPKKEVIGFAEEEAVLNRIAALRMRAIEKATGFVFDKNTKPKLTIKNMWYADESGIRTKIAEYDQIDQSILISTSLLSAIEGTLGKPLTSAKAEEVLTDTYFIPILDHELGHLLSDQVSRRNGLGPWYTCEFYESLTHDGRTSLKVISEGFSMWVQHTMHPSKEAEKHSEKCFPRSCGPDYETTMICYHGGYWLVKDVIGKYGVRGLIWMIRNPLVLSSANMRECATKYRKRALRELAGR